MTYEEATSRHSKEYFYWKGASIRNDVLWAYPELNHRSWALFSYFAQFLDSGTMIYIEYAGERYYYLNYAQAVSRLWIMGITTTQRISELFKDMCGLGSKCIEGKPYFFKQRNIHDIEKGILTYFCPTELFYRARDTSGITVATEMDKTPIVSEAEPIETPPEPEVLSDTLFDFYALLKKSTTAFDHHKPPSNDKPSKLWLNTDKYIKELMEGTFYGNNKDKFDKKAEDRGAIPKLTLPQIAELCKNVKVYSANGKPSIDNVFMQFDGKVFKSPILNYIWASLPPPMPTYSPEHIEELKAKYLSSKEMLSTVALNKASINRDNPYIYLLMDKMMDFFDDETRERLGKYNKKAPTKLDLTHLPDWCIMSFNSYKDSWKKKATWQTWEEWVQAFKVDDRKKYTPWFWMLYWVRKNSNGRFHLSEDTSIRTKIDDMIAHPYVGGEE